MGIEAFVRRHALGLWGLALLSAATMPVGLHIAAQHRAHWTPGPALPFWNGLGASLTVAWTLFGVLALAGWAAGTRGGTIGLSPARRAWTGARIGALGWLIWCVAAVPATVWIARLGVPAMPGGLGLGAGILAVVALVAGALGRWQSFGGMVCGAMSGFGLLWVSA
jgi:hypothetical protein